MKKFALILILALLAIQFIPISKNESKNDENAVWKKYETDATTRKILDDACNNCHSNSTFYPWYTKIQPIGFWLNHHVNEGKEHLNFSNFTTRPVAIQNHKFEEVIETVKEGEMPLASYTYFGLHPEANLNDEQKNSLIQWAERNMEFLKKTYPADSLILKKRKKD